MIINYNTSPPELERGDGWIYRLHGIVQFDWEHDWFDGEKVRVTLADASDKSLDTLRVLRDELPYAHISFTTL